eukprot:6809917-Heterocapsa_arctica.AAC.1
MKIAERQAVELQTETRRGVMRGKVREDLENRDKSMRAEYEAVRQFMQTALNDEGALQVEQLKQD